MVTLMQCHDTEGAWASDTDSSATDSDADDVLSSDEESVPPWLAVRDESSERPILYLRRATRRSEQKQADDLSGAELQDELDRLAALADKWTVPALQKAQKADQTLGTILQWKLEGERPSWPKVSAELQRLSTGGLGGNLSG